MADLILADALMAFDAFEALEDIDTVDDLRPPRRIVTDRMDLFMALSDGQFISRFHLSKDTTRHLLGELHLPEALDGRGSPVPPHIQLLITLQWLATGSLQMTIADSFNVSQQFVSKCTKQTVRSIAGLLQWQVKIPDKAKLSSVIKQFSEMSNFPEVVGVIDCTHIPIQNPSGEHAEEFHCSKGYYCINVQAVCGPDMQFYNIVSKPGSVHNSKIFLDSCIYEGFQQGQYQGVLLGDCAYPLLPFLMTPVPHPTTLAEFKYNEAHTTTRNVVKAALTAWKNRFRRLCIPLRVDHNTAFATIYCAAVVYNYAIRYKDQLPIDDNNYDGDSNDDDDCEDLCYVDTRDGVPRAAGQTKRTSIIQEVYS